MAQLTTTLKRIRAHNLSHAELTKLLAGLGKTQADDEPLPFATIVRISGLDFALWCARAEPQHARVWRLFLVWCERQVAAEAATEDAARAVAGDAAAWAAAWTAAWDAEREAQVAEFLRIVGGE
jgi:hypothetical protein